MSILKVANVHFESTGANRVDYINGNIGIQSNTANVVITINGNEYMRVDKTSGNVGIRTTNPAAALDVTGSFSIAKANVISQSLAETATIAWDTSFGQIANVTLTASRAFGAPTNLRVGTYILYIKQGGTGSYTITSWNSVFKWPGGVAPVLTTTAGATDLISLVSDGTNLAGTYINDIK